MITEQLINILNDKLRNPIYKTIQLINIKDILEKSNFTKKEGVMKIERIKEKMKNQNIKSERKLNTHLL